MSTEISLDICSVLIYYRDMKNFTLIAVLRPQQEFKSREIGNVFAVDETRLIMTTDGRYSLPNPDAVPGYMGPESVALFEEAK